jgi:hypothetical protein
MADTSSVTDVLDTDVDVDHGARRPSRVAWGISREDCPASRDRPRPLRKRAVAAFVQRWRRGLVRTGDGVKVG